MKKMIGLLIIIVFISTLTFGQINNEYQKTETKRHSIGGYGAMGFGQGMMSLSSRLRYAYMFQNRIELGFNLGVQFNGMYYKSINFEPNIRYYFSESRISPFMQIKSSFSISQRNYVNFTNPELGENDFGYSHSIGLGLRIKSVNEKFSIDAGYNIGRTQTMHKPMLFGNPSLMLNYHF